MPPTPIRHKCPKCRSPLALSQPGVLFCRKCGFSGRVPPPAPNPPFEVVQPPGTPAPPPDLMPHLWLLTLTLVLWSIAAAWVTAYVIARPARSPIYGLLTLVAVLLLSVIARIEFGNRRKGHAAPPRWGALPVLVLILMPILYAIWYHSAPLMVLAIPPGIFLTLTLHELRPLLPARSPAGAIALGILLYVSLGGAIDGLVGAPGHEPLEVKDASFSVEEEQTHRFPSGSGEIREWHLRAPGLPNLSAVAIVVGSNDRLDRDLLEAYSWHMCGVCGSLGAVVTLGFAFDSNDTDTQRTIQRDALAGGWTRYRLVKTVEDDGSLGTSTTADYQVFLLKPAGPVSRFTLLPPFFHTYDRYVGYRLHANGEYNGFVASVAGRIVINGVALDPPTGSLDGERIGTYRYGTPGLGVLVVLGACTVAAVWSRRRAAAERRDA